MRALQERVAHELDMLERINPDGAKIIREELKAWHERCMNQARTIALFQRQLRLGRVR